MPAKTNAKAVAGRAKKEENANIKKQAEQKKKDAKEDEEWSKGSKGKGKADDKAAKEEAARQRKAEAARLLAEEEASAPKTVKAAPKAGIKKATPAPAKASSYKADPIPSRFNINSSDDSESFSASGLDNALDMMTLVNEKTDKATVGSKAAKIETHPERRFKAAFEAYKEEQMPIIRKDFPGLRLQQYHDRLYKDFQKHPDNPFNQVSMDYNASKEEKVAALDAMRAQTEARLRQ